MKKLLLAVVGLVLGVFIGHAMMSFYWLTFNPAGWTAEARYIALNLYFFFGGAFAYISYEVSE